MKAFIVSGVLKEYADMLRGFGYSITEDTSEASLMVFTGGEDVSPMLYGASRHPTTHAGYHRDAVETVMFQHAKSCNIPMLGICRGGQFLNVMNGGSMYQHVQNHTRSHEITDVLTGLTVFASSTHHQMMKPSKKGLIVATAALGGEREWYDGNIFHKDVSKMDIEVVYYAETRSLCFQPHPELHYNEYDQLRDYLVELMNRYEISRGRAIKSEG